MPVGRRHGRQDVLLALLLLSLWPVMSCRGAGLTRQYEYEEQIYLQLDGSATVVVNASVDALVALRGLPLDPDPTRRFDRDAVRTLYNAPGVRVDRVSPPWRRDGRRFVQVRLEIADIRRVPEVAPLAWSRIGFERRGETIVYTQHVGPPAGTPPPAARWSGQERVLFRLHVPSRIAYHNAPTRQVERGNILSWEQSLADRLKGVPIEIEVHMDRASIFRQTMTVFAASVGAALTLLVILVWWVRRKGQAAQLG